MGAIQFIENLDRTTLTIPDEEFEKNVEAAVSAIAERESGKPSQSYLPGPNSHADSGNSSRAETDTRKSTETEKSLNRKYMNQSDGESGTDEKAAVSGILRTIQKPLSSIGRIFSEELGSPQYPGNNIRTQTIAAYPPETPRRLSPAVFQPPRNSNEDTRPTIQPRVLSPQISAEDAAARQASAETAEAQRIQRVEQRDIVEYDFRN